MRWRRGGWGRGAGEFRLIFHGCWQARPCFGFKGVLRPPGIMYYTIVSWFVFVCGAVREARLLCCGDWHVVRVVRSPATARKGGAHLLIRPRVGLAPLGRRGRCVPVVPGLAPLASAQSWGVGCEAELRVAGRVRAPRGGGLGAGREDTAFQGRRLPGGPRKVVRAYGAPFSSTEQDVVGS